jgi:hypothetical protein
VDIIIVKVCGSESRGVRAMGDVICSVFLSRALAAFRALANS